LPAPRLLLLSLRLGLYQACLGGLSVLTLGIFNRLLINEFAVPAGLAALALGAQQLVAFTRVWFGQRSDRCRWLGLRRTPFIVGGAAAFCLLFWLAGRTVLWVADASQAGDGAAVLGRCLLLTLLFLAYGMAIAASATPFAALLVDVTEERERPVLVSIVWTMLTVGIVVGAVLASRFLGSACADASLPSMVAGVERLIRVAPLVCFGLVLISVLGVERPFAASTSAPGSSGAVAAEPGFWRSLRLLRADPQVGYFFVVLCLFTFSLFLQESVLEPYGGSVFGLSVCETTRLNALWGMGTLLGIGSTGFLLVPRLGPQRTALLGGVLAAAFLLLIVLAGAWGSLGLFRSGLVLFGYGAGVCTNASLTLMLSLTSPRLAGTFLGVWGLAQAYARGIGTVAGGGLLSLVGGVVGGQDSFAAYASVFVLQSLGLLLSGLLLLRVDTTLFQQRIEQAFARLAAAELD
jgi:BCD family chlorophyll transporter-like MFS transporter